MDCRIQLGSLFFFFFNDTATTEIYTLSLHDALPISPCLGENPLCNQPVTAATPIRPAISRSEEHTSELQSQSNLVCRLLLEKKKTCCSRSPAASLIPARAPPHRASETLRRAAWPVRI